MLSINRILLLDDDANAHIFVKDILHQLTTIECEVIPYFEYDTAMHAVKAQSFDLCIVDYELHDPNNRTGIHFIHETVRYNPYLPCILFTGTGNHITELEGIQVGAVDYLDKTKLNRHVFQRTIQYALRRAKTMRELYILYQQTQLTNEFRSDMMRLAAHDIKNPLSTIYLSLQILKGKSDNLSKDDLLRHIERMEGATNRIKSITEDILAYDKIGASTDFEPTNMTTLIESVISDLTIQGDLQNKKLTYKAENLPVVRAVPGQLREVLHNLLSNAVKYTGHEGEITIQTNTMPKQVVVSVTDNGIGIARSEFDKLFKPFYRVNSDATKHIAGTGLGLYLVKQIVERHAGKITVASVPDEGSTFTFHIPTIKSKHNRQS